MCRFKMLFDALVGMKKIKSKNNIKIEYKMRKMKKLYRCLHL